MSTHTSHRRALRSWLKATTALAGALPLLGLTISLAHANPQGGVVAQGSATITQPDAKTVQVNQSSDRAVIDWKSFSIAAGETTRFIQPSSSSMTLNRVTGDQVSQILGNLQANGRVILVNPNGIVFGDGAKIDVAALVASTANIKTENFMAGNLRFDIPGKAGAQIINQGTITAADGGLVALVSPSLRNSGIISARLGKVVLAAANGVTLDLYGDNLILFQASDKITQQVVGIDGQPVSNLIENTGKIYADGGRVLLTANTAKGVVDNAINTTGLISASAVEQRGGEIVLKGEDAGIVQVSGSLDASGKEAGQKGGRVTVQGDSIAILSGAKVDTSGDTGGGNVDVGNWQSSTARMEAGASIDASAKSNGNAGNITMISANTDAAGTFLARGGENGGGGGQVETSGHFLRVANAKVDASARFGKSGRWFLDPYDIDIDAAAATSIGSTLDNGTDVALQTNLSSASGGIGTVNSTGNGDITVASALGWTGAGNLSLSAYRNVQINAAVTHGGIGLLTLTPDNASTGTGTVLTGSSGSVSFTGTGALNIGGHNYTLIRTLSELQGMSAGGFGYRALANDIDASATAGWNNGEGFRTIGYDGTSTNIGSAGFTGTLDGLGHTITNLTINIPAASNLGLISWNFGTLRNLGLVGGSVTGAENLGMLAGGGSSGSITNSYATGRVSGSGNIVGGLIGYNDGVNISDSYATGDITGSEYVGGLVGANTRNISQIIRSYAAGQVSGKYGIGGLIGNNVGLISNSYATGAVSGNAVNGGVSGISGLSGINSGTISNSFSSGAVSGSCSGAFCQFYYVGDFGGLVGLDNGGTVNNSFWNTQTTGQQTSAGGGTGLDTNGMKTAANFVNAGWDASTWNLVDGQVPTRKTPTAPTFTPGTWTVVNPFLGLDASALYAAIINANLAGSYSTDTNWVALKTANGGNPTAAELSADIMLNAYNRYHSFSGQALADKLYQDVVSGFTFTNSSGTYQITNDSTNPLWKGSYGPQLSAGSGQVTANVMLQSWRYYNTADKRSYTSLFTDLRLGTVTLDGPGSQTITDEPTNPVWRGLYGYGTGMNATGEQEIAHLMRVSRTNYYHNYSDLKQAVTFQNWNLDDSNVMWLALKDGWGTSTLRESAVQTNIRNYLARKTEQDNNIPALPDSVLNPLPPRDDGVVQRRPKDNEEKKDEDHKKDDSKKGGGSDNGSGRGTDAMDQKTKEAYTKLEMDTSSIKNISNTEAAVLNAKLAQVIAITDDDRGSIKDVVDLFMKTNNGYETGLQWFMTGVSSTLISNVSSAINLIPGAGGFSKEFMNTHMDPLILAIKEMQDTIGRKKGFMESAESYANRITDSTTKINSIIKLINTVDKLKFDSDGIDVLNKITSGAVSAVGLLNKFTDEMNLVTSYSLAAEDAQKIKLTRMVKNIMSDENAELRSALNIGTASLSREQYAFNADGSVGIVNP